MQVIYFFYDRDTPRRLTLDLCEGRARTFRPTRKRR
jgi:hypothetical protein